jgi:hypothetical protein
VFKKFFSEPRSSGVSLVSLRIIVPFGHDGETNILLTRALDARGVNG